jgi:hypothetical protein
MYIRSDMGINEINNFFAQLGINFAALKGNILTYID